MPVSPLHGPSIAVRLARAVLPSVLASFLAVQGPAAPATTGGGEASFPEDSRLARKVTLKLKKTPLSEVTAELSRQSGVTLTTRAEVMDEPVVVWVTDQPAREVMRQLAELLDYRWRTSGAPGDQRYELYQDLKGKRQEEALRQRERRRALEALQVDLRRRVERLREHPNASQEADLLVVSSLTTGHWNALVSGRMLHFSTRTQPGVLPLPPALASKLEQLKKSRDSNPSPTPADVVSVRLWLTFRSSEVMLQSSRDFRHGQGSSSSGGMVANANSQFRPAPRPADPKQVARWQQDPALRTVRPFGVDPRKAAPLKRARPGEATFLHLYEILPEIAETYGVDLVADAYWSQLFWKQPALAPEEMPLYVALQKYVEGVAEWTRVRGVLRVRSRNWFNDRMAEVPESVIRRWSAHLRRERRTTLEGEAALALALRDEQWAHFLGALQDEGVHLQHETHHGAEGSRELLRAYGSLSASQQQSLRSGQELASAQLPAAARRWLVAALEQRQRSFPPLDLPLGGLPPGALSLSATTVQREVTSDEPDQVRTTLRILDGPRAGQQVGSTTSSGTLRPHVSEGGQVFQQVVLRYRYGDQQALTFNVELPWVYVDPSVKGPAAVDPTVPAR